MASRSSAGFSRDSAACFLGPAGRVFTTLQATPYDAFIRLDVNNFYPKVPHDRLEAALEGASIPQDVCDILMRALRTPTVADRVRQLERSTEGVPQGLAISNVLAEFVAHGIDQEITALGSCEYFRYVDDILIFCAADNRHALAQEARRIIRRCGLEAHPLGSGHKSAIGVISDCFDYLGYEFRGPTISVRPSSVHKLEARLARVFAAHKRAVAASKGDQSTQEEALRKCYRELNIIITGFTHRRVEQGWVRYYRQLNDFKLLNELDATVRRFRRRFCMPEIFKPMLFTKVDWAARYPNTRNFGYIPNPDKFDIPEQRRFVEDMLGASRAAGLDDAQVQVPFREIADRFSADSSGTSVRSLSGWPWGPITAQTGRIDLRG